jgi:tellurite resistance protein TerC
VTLLNKFHTLIYFFGAFLIVTGLKLLFAHEDESPKELQDRAIVKFVRRVIPTTEGYRGARLFVKEGGRLMATPLFTTLIVVELSDVMFAVDSIPAVLAVTNDFYVAYTSNIFAILGLRALFFVVSASVERFHYLKPALSFILVFVGVKMVLGALPAASWTLPLLGAVSLPLKIKPMISLSIIVGALLVAIFFSVRLERRHSSDEEDEPGSKPKELISTEPKP